MFGLDEWISSLGDGSLLLLVGVVAVLLGLRHATDPDHLSAVSAIVAAEVGQRVRTAARVGLAWGLGHATTLFLFGLPIVLYAAYLPERVLELAEALVGVMIVGLAVRLLLRWRRGLIHFHAHEHDAGVHAHLHAHSSPGSEAGRRHHDTPSLDASPPVRSALGAYSIGLVHGFGGSAGVGALLLASISNRPVAVIALAVFAAFTAVSMALFSGALGAVLSAGSIHRRSQRLVPALGVASMAFGAWYFAGALALAPYPF